MLTTWVNTEFAQPGSTSPLTFFTHPLPLNNIWMPASFSRRRFFHHLFSQPQGYSTTVYWPTRPLPHTTPLLFTDQPGPYLPCPATIRSTHGPLDNLQLQFPENANSNVCLMLGNLHSYCHIILTAKLHPCIRHGTAGTINHVLWDG